MPPGELVEIEIVLKLSFLLSRCGSVQLGVFQCFPSFWGPGVLPNIPLSCYLRGRWMEDRGQWFDERPRDAAGRGCGVLTICKITRLRPLGHLPFRLSGWELVLQRCFVLSCYSE